MHLSTPRLPIASYGAAQLALHGILAALLVRQRTGVGQRVETSLLSGEAAFLMRQDMGRGGPDREGLPETPRPLHRGIVMCFLTAECADGKFIQMCARQDHHFRNWMVTLGMERHLRRPALREGAARDPDGRRRRSAGAADPGPHAHEDARRVDGHLRRQRRRRRPVPRARRVPRVPRDAGQRAGGRARRPGLRARAPGRPAREHERHAGAHRAVRAGIGSPHRGGARRAASPHVAAGVTRGASTGPARAVGRHHRRARVLRGRRRSRARCSRRWVRA